MGLYKVQILIKLLLIHLIHIFNYNNWFASLMMKSFILYLLLLLNFVSQVASSWDFNISDSQTTFARFINYLSHSTFSKIWFGSPRLSLIQLSSSVLIIKKNSMSKLIYCGFVSYTNWKGFLSNRQTFSL